MWYQYLIGIGGAILFLLPWALAIRIRDEQDLACTPKGEDPAPACGLCGQAAHCPAERKEPTIPGMVKGPAPPGAMQGEQVQPHHH